MNRLARAGGAIASGLALALCYAPFQQSWLVWGWLWILLPLLWTVSGKRKRLKGFGLAYLSGLAFWLINVKWVWTVTGLGALVMAGYFSVYFGIFGAFAAVAGNPWREKTPLARRVPQRFREMGRSLGFAVVLGGFWCGMEWIRGWMLTGFGWNGLGVAFSKSLMLAQNAEFVGVIGLAFLPVFLSAVVVQVGCRFYQQSIIGGVKMLHWDFASALLVVMGAFTLGTFRFVAINSSEKITAKVLLVQQNIPQKAGQILWSRQEIVDGFVELTEDGIEQAENNTVEALKTAEKDVAITSGQPDFVVWPEACLPEWFNLDEEGVPTSGPDMESIIGYAASLGNFTLLSGINEVEGNPADPSSNVYNSLLALDPSGRRQSFKKHHLVYFGEAIPDIEALRDLYERTTGVPFGGGLTPGSGFEPFELSWKDEKIGAIPSICFEDTVPRLTRKFVRAEPQMIVNVTNDGWFQESEAAEQHFENALFRCIELRRPMLRSANQGVTCVISVVGSTYDPVTNEDRRLVDEKGSHFQRGSLLANIYLPKDAGITLYARFGDWFAVTGLSVGLLWGIWVRIQMYWKKP